MATVRDICASRNCKRYRNAMVQDFTAREPAERSTEPSSAIPDDMFKLIQWIVASSSFS